MAEHVAVQLILGLGAMRTLCTGKRSIRVAGDFVELQLTLTGEALVAHWTPFRSSAMDLPMEEEIILGGEGHVTVLAGEDLARARTVDLPLMGLQAALGEVSPLTDVALVVLLPQVQLVVEGEVALDHELLAAGLALELLDPRVGLEMSVQLLGRAEGHVTAHAEMVTLVDFPSGTHENTLVLGGEVAADENSSAVAVEGAAIVGGSTATLFDLVGL
eukprot:maker-scaffold250_size238258-snap-gene-1.16 protein:Tk02988 transcript:maker-scaffold250_size238258-snap-gene-1.16-mRNA-1 annotation:"fad-dependent oxidoreductase"